MVWGFRAEGFKAILDYIGQALRIDQVGLREASEASNRAELQAEGECCKSLGPVDVDGLNRYGPVTLLVHQAVQFLPQPLDLNERPCAHKSVAGWRLDVREIAVMRLL